MSGSGTENPLGLGLIVVGAAALAVSVFLPVVQPVSALRMIEDNTLIQHGGWVFLACALGIVGGGYRAGQGKQSERWILIVVCAFAALLLVYDANDKGLRTLYPVMPGGSVDTTQSGVVANLGIAIYVAGAGVAAAFMGTLSFFQGSGKEIERAVDTQPRSAGKPVPRPRPQPRSQRTQAELEADAEAAEADAVAAEARARAIRLRNEAQRNTKATSTQNSGPSQHNAQTPARKPPVPKPRDSPARALGLRVDDRVQVLASGSDYLKTGTVTRILDDGEVEVKLGKMSGTYVYGSDELRYLDQKIRW